MAYFAERRKYQRCSYTICKVAMWTSDNFKWHDIELLDISAGGLKFASKEKYDQRDHLFFDICVYNMLSEFNMKLEGHIVREEMDNGKYLYSVKFENINKYCQIQLDEIIKSKVTVSNLPPPPTTDDGIYTFLFIPRTRPGRLGRLR